MDIEKTFLHDDFKNEALAKVAFKCDHRRQGLHYIDVAAELFMHGQSQGVIECHSTS